MRITFGYWRAATTSSQHSSQSSALPRSLVSVSRVARSLVWAVVGGPAFTFHPTNPPCPKGWREYLDSKWNWLDLVIVIGGLVDVVTSNIGDSAVDTGAVQTLRVLRVLRPLRTVSRIPAVKVVVDSLIESVPAMMYMCFVSVHIRNSLPFLLPLVSHPALPPPTLSAPLPLSLFLALHHGPLSHGRNLPPVLRW